LVDLAFLFAMWYIGCVLLPVWW